MKRRVCIVYDCLFPWTVGGGERWLRSLAERLAADGHEVTYLTLRQWPRGERPEVPGVRVVAAGPRFSLYTESGRRRMLPPLVFGLGVLLHLLRNGRRYDVVHTGAFPYFSLLAAAAVRPLHRFGLVVDWFEWWSRDYWASYLGRLGRVGWLVQVACARVPQRAFCLARSTAARLRDAGLNGEVQVLRGLYTGPAVSEPEPAAQPPVAVFAGRHIPEKGVLSLPPALEIARRSIPDLRLDVYGDGPDFEALNQAAVDGMTLHGFAGSDAVDAALRTASCLVLPSRREGYGMVVVEAAARGCPSVVVAHPDNAATELIEEGVNGVVASSTSPAELGAAIVRVAGDPSMRASTARWYAQHAEELTLEASLAAVAASYGPGP